MSPEEKGFRRTLRKQGRDLKLLSGDSGAVFRATVNRIGAFTLPGELSDDPRGKRIIEIVSAGAPLLASTNLLQELKNGKKHMICGIGLDSPDYSLKYVIQEGVPGKDDWA